MMQREGDRPDEPVERDGEAAGHGQVRRPQRHQQQRRRRIQVEEKH